MLKQTVMGLVVAAACAVMPAQADVDSKLDSILEARSDKQKARDVWRHPKEMMELFEIGEGQTVADQHGGGWYGAILLPLIGEKGHYIGAEIAPEDQAKYRKGLDKDAYKQKQIDNYAKRTNWSDVQPKFSLLWQTEAPKDMYGTIDRYVFFRVLHHHARIGQDHFDEAIKEAFDLLKPGGIAGVIQHMGPEGHSDEWASGKNGYIKRSQVIETFLKAGFVLEAESKINMNPNDQPRDMTADFGGDKVWRLPPSKTTKLQHVGESNRMTLKFRKPAGM